MELRKTGDPWYVKQLLGHKRLEDGFEYVCSKDDLLFFLKRK